MVNVVLVVKESFIRFKNQVGLFLLSCSWQYRSLDHDIGFGVFFSEVEKKSSKDLQEMVRVVVFKILA